ncbi:MAG: tape measure protein, partial [Bacteroides sp.]|nr:tape measure protein [Bacteroides sp.]
NIEAEKVMPMLRAIGDVSMGDAQKFNSLALAFSQMSATGKLMGQDLLQMINAGFNPLSVISEKTGKSIGELKEEMEKGKISVEMVTEAFMDATSEGGKFYQMLEKQGKGMTGAIAQMQGAFDDALNEIGKDVQGTVVTLADAGTYLAKHYDTILAVVGSAVAAFGAYKAALMVNIAVERMMESASAKRLALIESEINAVGLKTAQQQLSMDADIAEAVAKGQLTEAEGLHILALKQEAAERVASLALSAKQAATAVAEATAARQTAAVRLHAAEANAAAMRIEYEAILAKGDAFEIALAKERMETAQSQINAAAQEYQAAATAETAAAKAAQTAQTAANTAAQQLNNIAVQKGTVQTGVFATAVRMLTNGLKGLWATMMKHPAALLLAAIAALAVAVYNLNRKTKELSAEQQILDDVTGKASASVAEEKTKVETLSKIIHDNTKKLQERKTALSELQKIVPDYHAALTKEGNLINDNTDALNRYIDALMKAAKLEALKGGITDTFKQLSSLAMDVKGNRSDFGTILNMFSSDQSIEKNKQMWEKWYKDFLDDPTKYTRKDQNGRTEVRFGEGVGAQWLNADMDTGFLGIMGEISKQERDLIRAAEKYAEFSRLYQSVLSEEVSTKSDSKPEVWKEKVADEQKKLKEAQAEVKKLQASATATVAEVKDAQGKVDAAKKQLKELGVNVDKEGKSGEKTAEIRKNNSEMLAKEAADRLKQSEEYARRIADQERDNEMEIRQARIDAMQDGLEKELLQSQLTYDRLEEQNKRRMREMLDAVAEQRLIETEDKNPTAFKKTSKDGKLEDDPGKRDEELRRIRYALTIEDLSPEQKKQIEEFGKIAKQTLDRSTKDIVSRQREAMNEYLKDYGTMEEKRAAISALYADKIAKATSDGMRMRLMQEEQSALDNLEFDDFIKSRAALAFGEIRNLSQETIAALIKEMEKYQDEVTKTFDPDKIKKFNDALAGLRSAQANKGKNVFDQMFTPAWIKERESLQKEIDTAEKTHNDLLDAKVEKEEEVKDKIDEIIEKVKELAGIELTPTQVVDGSAVSDIIAKLDGHVGIDGTADMEALTKALDDAKTRIEELRRDGHVGIDIEGANILGGMNRSLQTSQMQLGNVTKAAGEAGNALAGLKEQFMANFSGGGNTIQAIDTIVHAINDSVQELKATIDDLANTADALGADTSVGSGWDKATTLMGAFSEASAGATKAWESFKSGNPMGVVQGVVQSFTAWVRGFAAIHDAKYERIIQNLQKDIEELERIQKRLERNREGTYSKDTKQAYEEEIRNIEQQRRLIQQQIAAERDKKNSDDDRIQEWKDQLEELQWQIEDYRKAAQDAIFGSDIASQIDSFESYLTDAWASAGNSATAAKDMVKEMMRQMAQESIKAAIESSGAMQRIRDKLVEFYTDDILSDWEQDYIYNMADDLQQQIDKQFSWSKSLFRDDYSQQQGIAKSFASMSQETGDAIEGRMTALLVSSQEIKTINSSMEGTLKESLRLAHDIRDLMEEFINIGIASMAHLESIETYTRNLVQMREDLESIERHVRNL